MGFTSFTSIINLALGLFIRSHVRYINRHCFTLPGGVITHYQQLLQISHQEYSAVHRDPGHPVCEDVLSDPLVDLFEGTPVFRLHEGERSV